LQLGQLVIHPCSSFRFYWDALMLIILFVDLNLLPLKLSFLHNAHAPALDYFEIAIKTIHVIDIALNFRTGIIQVTSSSAIAR
jgi:hyperpolarization activated cyclic nucleotide-gated potassium channel 2